MSEIAESGLNQGNELTEITQSGLYQDNIGQQFLVTQGLSGYTLVDRKQIGKTLINFNIPFKDPQRWS